MNAALVDTETISGSIDFSTQITVEPGFCHMRLDVVPGVLPGRTSLATDFTEEHASTVPFQVGVDQRVQI